jgi:hypothetical protein
MATKEQSLPLQDSSRVLPVKITSVPRRDRADAAVGAWGTRPCLDAPKATDRIAGNFFPVVEIPKFIFSAESRFQTDQEIVDACGGAGPLPFLLKGAALHTLLPLQNNSVFGPAIREDSAISREHFAPWLVDMRRSDWAIQLLNRFLRFHAWKRGLRFDEGHSLFYFTRSKPKKLWWEARGKIAQREVTAPHMKHYEICGEREVEFQCGWKHEAVRAAFVLRKGSLFVQLEPAWFLTELDGKTAATSHKIGPLNSFESTQAAAAVVRTLSFWGAVLAKGHRELRIETSGAPIRARLVSPSSCAPRVISKDDAALDYLALTGMEDDGAIPELGPVET